MITKTGSQIIKEAFIVGGAVGGIRSMDLSDDERKALIKEYGLPDDASIGWRNAGRGMVGQITGALSGSTVGHLLGSRTLGGIGALAGAIGGMKYMTDKYSKGNADKIIKRKNIRD